MKFSTAGPRQTKSGRAGTKARCTGICWLRKRTSTVDSPAFSRLTSPSGETFTVWLFGSYTAKRVTSRSEPSEKLATACSATEFTGSMRICSRGVTVSFFNAAAVRSSLPPLRSHAASAAYSGDPGRNRCPPSCATEPVALSKMRLVSGSNRLTRRPPCSRVSACQSRSGS